MAVTLRKLAWLTAFAATQALSMPSWSEGQSEVVVLGTFEGIEFKWRATKGYSRYEVAWAIENKTDQTLEFVYELEFQCEGGTKKLEADQRAKLGPHSKRSGAMQGLWSVPCTEGRRPISARVTKVELVGGVPPRAVGCTDASNKGKKLVYKDEKVAVDDELHGKLFRLANACHRGRPLCVTSAYRGPERQADEMYKTLQAGKSLPQSPKEPAPPQRSRATLAREVQRAYQDALAIHRARPESERRQLIVAAMAQIIRGQVCRGEFVSNHLVHGAVDLRTAGVSTEDGDRLIRCLQSRGAQVFDERWIKGQERKTRRERQHLHVNLRVKPRPADPSCSPGE